MIKPVGRYWVFIAPNCWTNETMGMKGFVSAHQQPEQYSAFIDGYKAGNSEAGDIHVWDSETGEFVYEEKF